MIFFGIYAILFGVAICEIKVRWAKGITSPIHEGDLLVAELYDSRTNLMVNGTYDDRSIFVYSPRYNGLSKAFCDEGVKVFSLHGKRTCKVRYGWIEGDGELYVSLLKQASEIEGVKNFDIVTFENDDIPTVWDWEHSNRVWIQLIVIFCLCVFGLALPMCLCVLILRKDQGNKKMQKIAQAIRKGSYGFLLVQYITVYGVAILTAIGIMLLYFIRPESDSGAQINRFLYGVIVAATFLFGVFCSGSSGIISMLISVQTNVRVTSAARRSYGEALRVALFGGTFVSYLVNTFCVMGLTLLFFIVYCLPKTTVNALQTADVIVGFAFGASFSSLFAQLGGGIFTKAADMGADLVGKNQNDLEEDDMRNPAVVADLVGDNVGDCAGRGADLYETISANVLAVMILGTSLCYRVSPQIHVDRVYDFIMYPLLSLAFGLVSCLFGILCIVGVSFFSPKMAVERVPDDEDESEEEEKKDKEISEESEEAEEVAGEEGKSAEAEAEAEVEVEIKAGEEMEMEEVVVEEAEGGEPIETSTSEEEHDEGEQKTAEEHDVNKPVDAPEDASESMMSEGDPTSLGQGKVEIVVESPAPSQDDESVDVIANEEESAAKMKGFAFDELVNRKGGEEKDGEEKSTKEGEEEEEDGKKDEEKERNIMELVTNPVVLVGMGFCVVFVFCCISTILVNLWCFGNLTYSASFDDNVDQDEPKVVWVLLSLCGIIGIIVSIMISFVTFFYTDYTFFPTKMIAKAAEVGGPANNIIVGMGCGLQSTFPNTIIICVGLLSSYWIGLAVGFRDENGENIGGIFGVAASTLGMLSTTPFILALDTFGPISDNAGGIAEMAGLPSCVREITDKLDAVGNTVKALTKGYAMASAALASSLVVFAFLDMVSNYTMEDFSIIDISIPEVFVAGLLGAVTIFIYVAISFQSVSFVALKVMKEVKRQFKSNPKILTFEEEPDYAKCVKQCTIYSLITMVPPGIIGVFTPVVCGFFFRLIGFIQDDDLLGVKCGCAFLVVSTITNVLMGMFLSNAGGAWDNAKKFVEMGNYGGKFSETHKAVVIGDTVGDPFKDTAGPSLNILITLVATVTLVIGPLWINNVGDN